MIKERRPHNLRFGKSVIDELNEITIVKSQDLTNYTSVVGSFNSNFKLTELENFISTSILCFKVTTVSRYFPSVTTISQESLSVSIFFAILDCSDQFAAMPPGGLRLWLR